MYKHIMPMNDFQRHMRGGRPHSDPNVHETTLVSEILDNFGRQRFVVSMTDELDYFEMPDPDGNQFCIEVVDVQDPEPENRMTVLKEWRQNREDAVRYYEECVNRYKDLVKAETSRMQSMDLRRQRVNYRPCTPDCCATCRFSHPVDKTNVVFEQWRRDRDKFFCRHPEVVRPDRTDRTFPRPHNPENGALIGGEDVPHDPHAFDSREYHLKDVCPLVQGGFVCDFYEPRLADKYRDPRHSDRQFEEHDQFGDNRLDQVVRYEVAAAQSMGGAFIDANADYTARSGPHTALDAKIEAGVNDFMMDHPVGLINAGPDEDEDFNEDERKPEPPPEEIVGGGGAL